MLKWIDYNFNYKNQEQPMSTWSHGVAAPSQRHIDWLRLAWPD